MFQPIALWSGENNLVDSISGNDMLMNQGVVEYEAGAVGYCFDLTNDSGPTSITTSQGIFTALETDRWKIDYYVKRDDIQGGSRYGYSLGIPIVTIVGIFFISPDWNGGNPAIGIYFLPDQNPILFFPYTYENQTWTKTTIEYRNGAWHVFINDTTELTCDTSPVHPISITNEKLSIGGGNIQGGSGHPFRIDEIQISKFIKGGVMTPELETYLIKEQAVFGTVGDTLTGSDGFACTPDSKVDVVPENVPIDIVSGGYDQDISVVGAVVKATAQIGIYIQGTNNSTKPDASRIIRATGFEEIINVTGTTYMYEYLMAHYFMSKDLALWHYSGAAGADASLLKKFGNIVGDWKISAETGKPCKFELVSGKGKYIREEVSTKPTITKSSLLIPAVLPITCMFDSGSITYNVQKFEFSGGGTVDQYMDCAASDGTGASEITKKKVKFTMTLRADASQSNPLDAVLAGAFNHDLYIYFGASGKKVGINCTGVQYLDSKQGNSSNLTTWEINGLVDSNNISLRFNYEQLRVSDFTYAKTTALNVQFTNQTAPPPDTYDWDFGDGTTHGTTTGLLHTYSTGGLKVVKMTTVKSGVTSSITRTILVT